MRHRRYKLALTTVVISFLVCSCSSQTKDGIFLIPQGFKGGVVILFDQPNGIERNVEAGRFVYPIPSNGVLLVKGPPETGLVRKEYYYVSTEGERRRIEQLRVTGDNSPDGLPQNRFGDISEDDFENKVFVMNTGGFGSFNTSTKTVQYTSFVVSTPRENSSFYSQLQDRLFEIQKEFERGQ